MHTNTLLENVVNDLADLKAVNISTLDVHSLTSIADYMVIATGNSSRHVKSIAEHLIAEMKARDLCPNMQHDADDEWVLVDIGDVIVHIMQPRVRDYYNLEKLWAPEEASNALSVCN